MSQKQKTVLTIYECEICGAIDYSDDENIGDTGMVCCENKHFFCERHVNGASPDALEEVIDQAEAEGNIDPGEASEMRELVEIGEFVSAYSIKLLRNYIIPEWPEDLPEEICPVCTLRVIPNEILILKLLDMIQSNRDQIEEMIREECDTLDDAVETYVVSVEENDGTVITLKADPDTIEMEN